MEWFWSLALLVVFLGPIAWALVSRVGGEPPEGPAHRDVDTYRERFINWPKRRS